MNYPLMKNNITKSKNFNKNKKISKDKKNLKDLSLKDLNTKEAKINVDQLEEQKSLKSPPTKKDSSSLKILTTTAPRKISKESMKKLANTSFDEKVFKDSSAYPLKTTS